MTHKPYRVWPNGRRMRRFAEQAQAIAFAQRAYIAQGIADTRPVTVDLGASYPIGQFGPWGWKGKDPR